MKTITDLENLLPNTAVQINSYTKGDLLKSINARRLVEDPTCPGFALNDAFAYCQKQKYNSFGKLANAIYGIANNRFNNPSFLELGSGDGALFEHIYNLGGLQYLAVDANNYLFEMSDFAKSHQSHYRILNLQDEIDLGYKFDVVLSFEFLEHIREDKTDNVIRTILNHTHSGSLFITSISHNKGVKAHINVKSRSWWWDRFAKEFDEISCHREQIESSHPFNWDSKQSHIFVLCRKATK